MQTTDRIQPSLTFLEELAEPAIAQYFATMNAQEYSQTAALFAPDGIMHPPFESDLIGPEAIAQYLQTEATGMQLNPQKVTCEPQENSDRTYRVTGKVHTPLFSVNVAWLFTLNPQQQITSICIKLLASPHELLKLRSKS